MDKDKVNVELSDIEVFKNEEYQGIKLLWQGNIGFGEYTIYQSTDDPNKWKADSECMDYQNNKWFLKKILESLIDNVEITG